MESSCAVHPAVAAARTCARCGRFACSACLDGDECVGCVERRPRAFPSWLFFAFSGVLLAAPLLGEVSVVVGLAQMFVACAGLPFVLVCVGFGIKRPRLLFAIGPALLGVVLSARLTMGVPWWVQRDAAPFIEAVEAWKQANGQYPPESQGDAPFPDELRVKLRASGCMTYRPKGASFTVTCGGIGFTKCTYDSAKGTWYGWD